MLERRQPLRQDSGLVEDLERVILTRHVQLVPRRAVERAALIGADLRRDAEVAQQREGTARDARACDVEVQRNLATAAEVHAPR